MTGSFLFFEDFFFPREKLPWLLRTNFSDFFLPSDTASDRALVVLLVLLLKCINMHKIYRSIHRFLPLKRRTVNSARKSEMTNTYEKARWLIRILSNKIKIPPSNGGYFSFG